MSRVSRHKRSKPFRPSGVHTTLNISDYPQLEQSIAVDRELTRLTYRFLIDDEHAYRSIGSCTTSQTAYGKCYDVSYELMKYLRSHGHLKARLLGGLGYKLIPDKDSLWGDADDFEDVQHHVVLVGDKVIDLTGAQFQEKNAWRWVYTLEQFKEEWEVLRLYDPVARMYSPFLTKEEHAKEMKRLGKVYNHATGYWEIP